MTAAGKGGYRINRLSARQDAAPRIVALLFRFLLTLESYTSPRSALSYLECSDTGL
jgi:hypothetical protein